MYKVVVILSLMVQSSIGQAQGLKPYNHPIPYQPLGYVCHYTPISPTIDGVLDKTWEAAAWSSAFVDIQGSQKPAPSWLTRFKLLWDSTYLYVGIYLEEPDLWATLRQRDTVIFYDNDIELFIDPDGDSHHYFEFELNTFGTLWDLLLVKPYRDMQPGGVFNAWDARSMRWAVKSYGTINNSMDRDSAWTVEMAIPLAVLTEGNEVPKVPVDGEQWRMNFSRVQHHVDRIGNTYKPKTSPDGQRLPEENWTWTPQGRINMHEPEHWGFIQFTTAHAGAQQIVYKPNPDVGLAWYLRQVYYQQRLFKELHGQYATDVRTLKLPQPPAGAELAWEVGARQYLVTAISYDTGLHWHLSQDGRIWSQKKPE